MSIHLLNKKGWHVWNQENIEKVKRDERLHSEEEKRKNEVAKRAASEHRLSVLRKNAIASTEQVVAEDDVGLKRRRDYANHKDGGANIHSSDLHNKLIRSDGDATTESGKASRIHKKANAPKERTFRDVLPEGGPWYSSRSRPQTSQRGRTSQVDAARAGTSADDPMHNLQARLARQRELHMQRDTRKAVSPLSTASTASSHWTPISTNNFTTVLRDSRPAPYVVHAHNETRPPIFDREESGLRQRRDDVEPHHKNNAKNPFPPRSDSSRMSRSDLRHEIVDDPSGPNSKVDTRNFGESRRAEVPSDDALKRTNRYQFKHSDEHSRRYSRRYRSDTDHRNTGDSHAKQRQSRFGNPKDGGRST